MRPMASGCVVQMNGQWVAKASKWMGQGVGVVPTDRPWWSRASEWTKDGEECVLGDVDVRGGLQSG